MRETARDLNLRVGMVRDWVQTEPWVRRVPAEARERLYRLPRCFKDTHAPASPSPASMTRSTMQERDAMARERANFLEQEERLARWIDAKRAAGFPVSRIDARQVMLSIVSEDAAAMGPAQARLAGRFRASEEWAASFMRRFGFSNRTVGSTEKSSRRTVVAVPLPVQNLVPVEELLTRREMECREALLSLEQCQAAANQVLLELNERARGDELNVEGEPMVGDFRRHVAERAVAEGITADRIWNMDEVPMRYDMLKKKPLERKDKKRVVIQTSGGETESFTVMLRAGMSGRKGKPILIFRDSCKDPDGTGSRHARLLKNNLERQLRERDIQVQVAFQKKAWVNEKVMLDDFLADPNGFRAEGEGPGVKHMLIMDSHRAHLTAKVKGKVHERGLDLSVIPAGKTWKVQPLDVGINKPFKDRMRVEWRKWFESGAHTFTAGGKMRCPTHLEVCEMVARSWGSLPGEILVNSWRRALLKG